MIDITTSNSVKIDTTYPLLKNNLRKYFHMVKNGKDLPLNGNKPSNFLKVLSPREVQGARISKISLIWLLSYMEFY